MRLSQGSRSIFCSGSASLPPWPPKRVRVEIAGTQDDPANGTTYLYVVQLGPTAEEGPNLVARTDTSMGGDYELNKAVLDRMMATIEFVGTTQ